MSYSLVDIPTQDRYVAAATLECPGTKRLTLFVSNAGVTYQLGRGIGQALWGQEVRAPVPIVGSFDRECDWIRFKSAAAGKPARVTVEAATAGDIGG